jgi:ribose-phosphate pyrophosphokinase
MKIYSGSSSQDLSNSIMQNLNLESNELCIEKFSDGEILPRFTESIRDEELFFVQSTKNSDSIVETLLVIDAAKRAGAKSFTLVAPFQGYSRQDKTDHIRSSIGAKMMSDVLEAVGMNRLITIDLHSSSIQGFYNTTVIHLNGNKIFTNYIKDLELENIVICSPDHGALKKNTDFGKAFPNAGFAVINKKRIKPNEIHSMELIGDVKEKNVIIVDDMCDTAGTLCKAAELLKKSGATSVRAIATHGILSGPAIDNINNSELTEIIVSDSLSDVYEKQAYCPKLVVISCSNLISNAIERLNKNISIHELNLI